MKNGCSSYSANYLYETKCDGFAGKVSERQFSYER